MTSATCSYESAMDALMGTPGKRSSTTTSTPTKRANANKTPTAGDRFIPQRSAMDFDVSNFQLTRGNANTENASVNASPAKEEYKKELAQTLMQTENPTNKVLAYKQKVSARNRAAPPARARPPYTRYFSLSRYENI